MRPSPMGSRAGRSIRAGHWRPSGSRREPRSRTDCGQRSTGTDASWVRMRAADLRSSPARLRRGLFPDLDRARLETIARVVIFVALGAIAGVAGVLNPLALVVGAVALGAVWLLAWRSRPQRMFHRA